MLHKAAVVWSCIQNKHESKSLINIFKIVVEEKIVLKFFFFTHFHFHIERNSTFIPIAEKKKIKILYVVILDSFFGNEPSKSVKRDFGQIQLRLGVVWPSWIDQMKGVFIFTS